MNTSRNKLQRMLSGACALAVMIGVLGCQNKAPETNITGLPEGTRAPASVTDWNPIVPVTVYDEGLDPNWSVDNGWGLVTIDQSDRAISGKSAMLVTGQSANAALFFSVKQNTLRPYPRRDYIGLRFWVYPSDKPIAPDDLSIAVVGSNKIPYWSKEDQSVPQQDVAYSGETPLAYLGISQPLQPGAWAEIDVFFNHLQYTPPTRYLTGFYLRGTALAKRLFYIDNVQLLALNDPAPPVVLSAAAVTTAMINVAINKDLDPRSAAEASNYVLSSDDDPDYRAPRAAQTASYDPENLTVALAFAKPLKTNVPYSLTVHGITDIAVKPNAMKASVKLPVVARMFTIDVDAGSDVHPISPYIYGVSGAPPDYLLALDAHLNSWGGNANTRYNWQLGNAWNAARDWEYRNGDYGYKGKSASDDFISQTLSTGADVLMTLPTIGWVASNNDNNTCSFPGADGKCSNAKGASCRQAGEVADPNRANVPSDVNSIVAWVKHMTADAKYNVRFMAMDNEPDVWGETHYDVHPKCTTYDEIRDKYIEYADAVRAVAPKALLFGPVSCCWYYYWTSMAGPGDKAAHGNKDLLPWFLEELRKHDEKSGVRTLDVLDIHYYPAGFYNDQVDAKMAAGRLRSTRSLWDKTYPDESWIKDPVYLIPRMKEMITANYPGTLFGISEWNWGADKTMNGALAIADVLGIYGREDVYFATYWRYPELNQPGFFGFRMFTNYDGKGSDFGDTSVRASSFDQDKVASYASLDSKTGKLMLMLINKDPDNEAQIKLNIKGFTPSGKGDLYRYSQAQIKAITHDALTFSDGNMVLPAYSISLVILEPKK